MGLFIIGWRLGNLILGKKKPTGGDSEEKPVIMLSRSVGAKTTVAEALILVVAIAVAVCWVASRLPEDNPPKRLWRQVTGTLFAKSTNPVEELKSIVALHNGHTSWGKDYAYDVRKTDSLVSPYQGIATYNNPLGYYYEVSFAYQDNQWVAKSWRVKLKADSCETEWYDGEDYLKQYHKSDEGQITGWNNAIAEYYKSQ